MGNGIVYDLLETPTAPAFRRENMAFHAANELDIA
jgi:hypothetical protein